MEEVWKDIKDREGSYQVSNFGRTGKFQGREIKPVKSSTSDYLTVRLWKNHKEYAYLIHRLAAQAFIPDPDNLPEVNHIDENIFNNSYDNPEWCNRDYNHNHSKAKGINAARAVTGKCVLQYDSSGKLLHIWETGSDAAESLNIPQGNISSCCSGKLKTAGGFKWQYE
nr:MAG TPA: homing endonuclease [Crassvirales sp.]